MKNRSTRVWIVILPIVALTLIFGAVGYWGVKYLDGEHYDERLEQACPKVPRQVRLN